MNDNTKTPVYNKRASVNYQRKKDRINLLLDKGTKERIKDVYGDISINSYIKGLIEKDLNGQTGRKKPITGVDVDADFFNVP